MTLPYQQANEITDRYIGTVIFLGDKPVYVIDYERNADHVCLTCSVVGEKGETIHPKASDPNLRDGPFHIGYINKLPFTGKNGKITYRAAYATRIPKRQWKQGLCDNNMEFLPNPARSFQQLIEDPMFRDMLMGKYPKFERAKALVKGSITSAAFARQLCVGRDELGLYKLGYRGQSVAYSEDGNKFKLSEKFTYLRELLENYGVSA